MELFFITGADALAQILTWKDADELFALAHFVGVDPAGPHPVRATDCPADRVSLLEVPAMAISSTDCRSGSAAASRSGTWCPTVSSSTSPSTGCTRSHHEPDSTVLEPPPGEPAMSSGKHRRPGPDPLGDVDVAARLAAGPVVQPGGEPATSREPEPVQPEPVAA